MPNITKVITINRLMRSFSNELPNKDDVAKKQDVEVVSTELQGLRVVLRKMRLRLYIVVGVSLVLSIIALFR